MAAAVPQNEQVKEQRKQKTKRSTLSLIRRLARDYVRPYAGALIVAIFFMAVSAGTAALLAALLQPILDDVLSGAREDLIIPVAIAICATFATRGITTYIHSIMMNKIGQSIVADVQAHLFSRFMKLDMAFFHANPSGQLISRVVNDVSVMRSAVTDTMTGLGKSFLTLTFLLVVMFIRDWQLTLAAFVVFPLLAFFVVYIGKRLRKISKNIQAEMGGLSDLLAQTFQGVRLVKSYGMEKAEVKKVTGAIYKVRDLNIKSVRVANLSTPFNDVIVGFIFAGIIVYGGYAVLAGTTTAGQLASFLGAFIMAYEPMKKLSRLNNALQVGLGAADRVFEMIDQEESITDKKGAEPLQTRSPAVTFENVDFKYEGTALKALSNISFTANPGEVTALVGPSGGGKSTIMNLIPRFYDVTGGAIKVDGQNGRDVTIESLRGHIALVSQDITIFNDSVIENIRFGKPDASDEAVYSAAKSAAAHDFILELEDGYETIVGEQGVKLSGGQKQRVSIARAILRDAPILLLDEATSALDNESEKLVQKALKALEKGRTTIVIAHRLTTVQDADQILVLDQGCIVEQGNHQSLVDAGGVYATMHRSGLSG